MACKDYTWVKYWMLLCERFVYRDAGKWKTYWEFKCDCGKRKIICINNVHNLWTISCWCYWLRVRTERPNAFINWNTLISSYRTYYWILERCNNPKATWYKYYGWRWIKVLWESFEDFYRDMGDVPRGKYSIDRIDNNWDYCKDNCRWANRKQQQNNTRYNVVLEYKWEKWTMKYWSDKLNIPYPNLQYRVKTWHNIEEILFIYK